MAGDDVAEEYLSSLADLTVNSKPLINMLTMLAEENADHAPAIVQAIESHITKVSPEVKLPVLYLIDSICKNVASVYVPLFTNNIVQIFASVFEKVDEKTRVSMFKLRGTWNDIFPAKKMYTLDLRIQHIDQNWPTQSPPPTSIHVNPKFLNQNKSSAVKGEPPSAVIPPVVANAAAAIPTDLEATILKKQQILLELQQKKRELELIQQKVMFGDSLPQAIVRPVLNEDMSKAMRGGAAAPVVVPKATPRAVVMPPAPTKQSNGPSSPAKTKIAPANSGLIAAAKSRDPRLARMQSAQIRPFDNGTKGPKENKKESKVTKDARESGSLKKRKSPQKQPSDSEADLLEDLLRKQKTQQAKLAQMAAKPVEKKVPEVRSAEDEIQLRQMAMLKAPVLGQLNRKPADSDKDKVRRRRDSPIRRDPRRRTSPKPEEKDSPSRGKHYKDSKSRRKLPRDKPSRAPVSKSENKKRDRKPERKEPEPKFSPEPEMVPMPEPRPAPSPTLEMITSSPSPEPPPPPVIGPDDVEPMVVTIEEPPEKPVSFKPVKEAVRGRNYSRRNKERSPTPPADVDLRAAPTAPASGKTSDEVVDVGKDVDLRKLAMASPKKRLSTDGGSDGPPNKRGKTDTDTIQLFGNMDMDERLPPRATRSPPRAPRTPPPPVISTTPPAGSPLADTGGANQAQASWADVKPPRPEAEVKPMTPLSHQLELQVADMERAELEGRGQPSSPSGERDRLGRPLLFRRLPNDPRARRESLHQHDGTGHHRPEDVEDLHVDDILEKAKEQLARGTMTLQQYNELMAQIVRMNENQKIRDAQRQRMLYGDGVGVGGGGASPPYDRPSFPPSGFRGQGPRRFRQEEEDGAPFARRRRGRGGMFGARGRMLPDRAWRESRFPHLPQESQGPQGHRSPSEWIEPDSRSQEAWAPPLDLSHLPLIPPTDPCALEAIASDPVKHISIDGTPREIRFYGNVAVAMLSFNSSREISFNNGMRRVLVAGLEIPCQFNGPPVPFLFQQSTHMVRLGAPTRELYLDDRFYEAHFDAAPVKVELAGVPCTAQLEGPPPQVRIAPHSNTYCLGSVLIIVDARTSFRIYLDAKPQRFEIGGRGLILKFTNRLKTVLINDVPVPLQFGGSPVPINFCDAQHFLRLTELPPGIFAGKVTIRGMEGVEGGSPLHPHDSNSMELPPLESKMEPLPPPATDLNRGMYMDLVSTTMGGALDVDTKVGFNYKVETEGLPLPPALPNLLPPMTTPAPAVAAGPPPVKPLNINDLFKSLVATGIISNQKPKPDLKTEMPDVKSVDFNDPDSLRKSQPGVVALLYSGIQCGSCGVRFPPEETAKYSQHLDWHFRQNRRDRDAARRGTSRKWYYDVSDWIQFEEIEDLEERAQSWFETEGQGLTDDQDQEQEVVSVPAPAGGVSVSCHVCHDRFDTFFHEDTEEWHLRHCVMVDDLYYHPACYQDSVKIPDEPLAVEKMETMEITAPPLLAPLKEEPVKQEESILVLEVDDEDVVEDAGEVEVLTADVEAVQELIEALVERVVMEEECERSPLEDDELEVLAVTNKEENRPPIDVIDVPETWDDEDFRPPSPAVFDPNRKIKQEPVDEMESAVAQVDQTISSVTSSIDGNVEMADAPVAPAPTASRIKITFSKPLVPALEPPPKPTPIDTVIDPSEVQIEEIQPEPLPLKPKKPRIAEREMKEYPTCIKGTEISGLCSIM